MSEDEAIQELKAMSDEELDLVEYERKFWLCSGKGCANGTAVRDYGIAPTFYRPTKSKTKKRWFDTSWFFWCCSKHNRAYKRLGKLYDIGAVQKRLFDFAKPRILDKAPPKPKRINTAVSLLNSSKRPL